MKTTEYQERALGRATGSLSALNYPAILQGFLDKGIPEEEIRPRENVFTFDAWRALGRYVRRGEHGVRVLTWVPMTKKDPDTGEDKPIGRRPKSAVVFHVSQTDARNGDQP